MSAAQRFGAWRRSRSSTAASDTPLPSFMNSAHFKWKMLFNFNNYYRIWTHLYHLRCYNYAREAELLNIIVRKIFTQNGVEKIDAHRGTECSFRVSQAAAAPSSAGPRTERPREVPVSSGPVRASSSADTRFRGSAPVGPVTLQWRQFMADRR